ncbi:MAG: HAD hydrolase-like protein [Asticcacaulis sp.]|nr:HAD hydrolase-like protein [Asticcacaulis sp.]
MNLDGYILAFDLDGTLVDSAPDIINALNVVLQEQGVKPYLLDEARPLIGRGAMELLRRGFALAGAPWPLSRKNHCLTVCWITTSSISMTTASFTTA